jgi:hypothetical protein
MGGRHTNNRGISNRVPRDGNVDAKAHFERHLLITPSLLGQTIKIRAVEFLPGVHNPGADAALDYIIRGIEIACGDLGFDLNAGVIPGVAPVIATSDCSADFFGAGTGIFGTLATFAHKLSTLLAKSVCFDPSGRQTIIGVEKSIRRIKADAALRGEWERFMLHGSGIFFKDEPTESRLTKRQSELKVQLMSAIEVFGLAQEYGCHIAQHLSNDQRSSLPGSGIQGLADEIAWSISRFLGERGFAGNFLENRNTWMESGSGAVALLNGARVIRRVREVILTGTHEDQEPSCIDYVARLTALENSRVFTDHSLAARFYSQRALVGRLIPSIFGELKLRFWAGHKFGLKPATVETLTAGKTPDNQGLIEILTKNVVPARLEDEASFAKHVGNTVEKMRSSSSAVENALNAIRGKTGAQITAPDEYLKHFQEKSVLTFAKSVISRELGGIDPTIASSVAERLSIGRTDGTRAGLQDSIDVYSVMLEPICHKLGLPLHEGVVSGIAWNPASGAAQMSVSESESIILIPESIMMLCHFVSKLLALTLPVTVQGKRLAINCNPEAVLSGFRTDSRLQEYAAGAFAYCATWNKAVLKPLPPTKGDQRLLWYQLLMGTELFIVAHEYSHHICRHGVTSSLGVDGIADEESKEQELDADFFGAFLSPHVGTENRLMFARTGSAAVVALIAVDMLRRAREVLATGVERIFTSNTHPKLEERLVNIQGVRYDPREAQAVRANQGHFRAIMEGIWHTVLPKLKDMHKLGVRPLAVAPSESQWLPFDDAALAELKVAI